MEGKGLRVNLAKTEVMIIVVNQGLTITSGKHPCGVCCKGVGSNSIICNHCAHQWVHKHCNGWNGRWDNVVDFKCRACLNPTVANGDDKKVQLGNVEDVVADQFCYLSDMLHAHGGTEASSISGIKSGWKKFRELLLLLKSQVKCEKSYAAFVKSVMLYDNDT